MTVYSSDDMIPSSGETCASHSNGSGFYLGARISLAGTVLIELR
jgi:hypothetical protein